MKLKEKEVMRHDDIHLLGQKLSNRLLHVYFVCF